jgi:hypothetical protein
MSALTTFIVENATCKFLCISGFHALAHDTLVLVSECFTPFVFPWQVCSGSRISTNDLKTTNIYLRILSLW